MSALVSCETSMEEDAGKTFQLINYVHVQELTLVAILYKKFIKHVQEITIKLAAGQRYKFFSNEFYNKFDKNENILQFIQFICLNRHEKKALGHLQ
jgi:hypothetical protein